MPPMSSIGGICMRPASVADDFDQLEKNRVNFSGARAKVLGAGHSRGGLVAADAPLSGMREDPAKQHQKTGLHDEKNPFDPHGHGCIVGNRAGRRDQAGRSEEHTSELQSLMRISYAVFCLKKKKTKSNTDDKYYK